MTMRRTFSLMAAAALWLPAAPAAAAPDASQPPRTSGPLIGVPLPCEDNGTAGRGEVHGQSCSWSYELAPADTDPARDFSAYWTQIEIDPGKGMCAHRIVFGVELEGDARIVSAAPAKGSRGDAAGVTQLVVDGDGAAPVPGTIEQDVSVPSGRSKVRVDESSYRYVWTGNSKDKVVIALGVQMSHGRVPPDPETSMSVRTGSGGGSCSPAIARLVSRV
ncbi:MAG TPA: hypothetical protein VEU29_00705 [Actinomycetota bacterium]|nr:hypothetical protein [Actinomycetota bacterium]